MKKLALVTAIALSAPAIALASGGDYNTNYVQGNHGYVGQIDGNHNEQWIGDDWSTNVNIDVDQSQNDYGDRDNSTHNNQDYSSNDYGDRDNSTHNNQDYSSNDYSETSNVTNNYYGGSGGDSDSDSPGQSQAQSEAFSPSYAQEIQSLHEADETLRAGIAGAYSAAAHQFNVGEGTGVQGSLAGGYYDGENAVSLAVGGQMTENTFGNLQVTHDSQSEWGIGVGVSARLW